MCWRNRLLQTTERIRREVLSGSVRIVAACVQLELPFPYPGGVMFLRDLHTAMAQKSGNIIEGGAAQQVYHRKRVDAWDCFYISAQGS